jgi:apolipoprotein N-acyltransferase
VTRAPRGPGFALALLGGAALACATPPAVLPGAEFLVFAGLAAWFLLARDERRSWWFTYLLGCVHMAWFSWSVHHVLLPAYVAIVVLGGGYFVLGTAAVRVVARRWQALAFGIAVAGSFWLRANVPAIHYPHGQPCHCLWQWPALLGSVTVGGEGLANALIGWLAASIAELWQGWRIGQPSWRRAWLRCALWVVVASGTTVVGVLVVGVAASPSVHDLRPVSVVVVEPGLHSFEYMRGLPETFEERLLRPTQAVLREGLGDSPPKARPNEPPWTDPRLVLWPESCIPVTVPVQEIAAGTARLLKDQLRPWAGSPRRLLLGVNVSRGDRQTPAAVLVDLEDGRILGHQEKRCLVPGGEFIPLLHLLPQSVVDWARGVFEQALGSMPDLEPGRALPLLHTAHDVPFGALLCYDNAFPGPAADQVAAGARFLCVLSNESWYRGGAELTQLMAMTVCRALEVATPIVRCTTDGWSGVVGADGHLRDELPIRPSPSPAARILPASFVSGAGRLPPLAWLRAAAGPTAAILLGLALLHGAWVWARLRVARTAPRAASGPGDPVPPAASGS